MNVLRVIMVKLKKVYYQIKLKHRIILISMICVLIPLVVTNLYFILTIRKINAQHHIIRIDEKTFLSYNSLGIILIASSIVLSCIIIVIFSYRYSNRLNAFKKVMHKAASGEFEKLQIINDNDEINELYRDLNTMINSIQHLISTVYEEQVQKEKLYSRQKDVEFKMLASQINPHFLYNTLETIRMKARTKNETEIEELVKMLAKIMRRNIQIGDKLVPLEKELELVEYYLRIQQYRYGERISYNIDIKCNIDSLKIVPLLIQPIVENAFIHGLESYEEKGEIRIIVEHKERLTIRVIDNGKGMSEAKLNEIIESFDDYSRLNSNHIGLNNVNQRIKLLYGDEYGLYITSKVDEGTSVCIELPEDITQ